jgi:hypothetical protein
MTVNHTHFEVLCALAASGQLTSVELAELHEHSDGCSFCSDRLVEMTQVSAELFCAHAANQTGGRMPKDMLARFVARANNEGIPLNPRAESAGLSGHALAAAFVFALLLMSGTYHFSSSARNTDETMRRDTAIMSASARGKEETSPGPPTKTAPGNARQSITASRQRSRGNGRGIPLLATRTNRRQVDLSARSQTFANLRLPFLVTAKLERDAPFAPARYGKPRFSFVEPSKSAEDDAPRLLAGYEPRFALSASRENLAFEPADVQLLRRDFGPDAYRTLLSPDFKQNVPPLQFSEGSRQ